MIRVRRLEATDLATRIEWLNSPAVYTQMVVDIPLSLAATQQWFAKNAMSDARRDFCFLGESDGADPPVMAMGGLTDINFRHGRAELYIVVDPARVGQGFGTPAVRWLCNFGFLQLDLAKIYLYTMAGNAGARRLYERLGFVSEGILRQHTRHHGILVDRHMHGLLRGDWDVQSWRAHAPLALHEQ
jgi:RimJ/RimL family protein N-acetyltransferase